MSENLMAAHRQWVTRPDDQRFQSLDALQKAVAARRMTSYGQTLALSTLRLKHAADNDIELDGLDRPASFTHWSFGQLCQRVGAPASYLRTLPGDLVVQNLNHGIAGIEGDEKIQVLSTGTGAIRLQAITSERYTRIWDADVVAWVRALVGGTNWRPPLANPRGKFGAVGEDAVPSGLYASDHDVWMFLVNASDPIEVRGERLGRGFFCWNSETGAATFGLTTFLYRYVCGNHIVWGASDVHELRLRHVGLDDNKARTELAAALSRYLTRGTGEEARRIEAAQQYQVARDDPTAIDWLQTKGFSRILATDRNSGGPPAPVILERGMILDGSHTRMPLS